ncbi:hypothetical protein CS8_010880 [Cupriavidus sp. 8B]
MAGFLRVVGKWVSGSVGGRRETGAARTAILTQGIVIRKKATCAVAPGTKPGKKKAKRFWRFASRPPGYRAGWQDEKTVLLRRHRRLDAIALGHRSGFRQATAKRPVQVDGIVQA